VFSVVELTSDLLPEANALAQTYYAEACKAVPALPAAVTVPDLGEVADAGMGVVAVDEGRVVGVLAAVLCFEGLFGPVVSALVPFGGLAVTGDQRTDVVVALYAAAARRWVDAGATSHAIIASPHNAAAIEGLYRCGFGRRTVDAIRAMESPTNPPLPPSLPTTTAGVNISEVDAGRTAAIAPLFLALSRHMRSAPNYVHLPAPDPATLTQRVAAGQSRCFVAFDGETPIGYLEAGTNIETFVDTAPNGRHLRALYLAPEARGHGVGAALLGFALSNLADDSIEYVTVDYEEFNPTARSFWTRHFTPYATGFARRIDERLA
jgi:GNAT superfamily N-acetyltransferase